MKASLFVDLKTALLAGVDNQGEYTMEFNPADLTDPQKNEILHTVKDSVFYINHHYSGISDIDAEIVKGLEPISAALLPTMLKLIDKRIELRPKVIAKKKAEEEKKKKEEIARIIEYLSKGGGFTLKYSTVGGKLTGWEYRVPYGTPKDLKGVTDPAVLELAEKIKPKAERALAKALAEEKERDEKREKRKKELEEIDRKQEEAKKKQIAAFVAKYGTESQRERLAENLLPEKEVTDAMRERAFNRLLDWPRYERLTQADINCDVDESPDCYDGPRNPHFETEEKETLTEREYNCLKELRAEMPDAGITVKEVVGSCGDCSAEARRVSFLVEVKVGAFTFSRRYGLNPNI